MKKIKEDCLKRLFHLPSTYIALVIIMTGMILVGLDAITMKELTAFIGVALPFFFYKANSSK